MNKQTDALKLSLPDRRIVTAAGDPEDYINSGWNECLDAIREALAEQPAQEPVACKSLCELCVKRGYNSCANAAQTTPIPVPQPAQQRPQNCGTGYCSCIECPYEQPAQQQEPEKRT